MTSRPGAVYCTRGSWARWRPMSPGRSRPAGAEQHAAPRARDLARWGQGLRVRFQRDHAAGPAEIAVVQELYRQVQRRVSSLRELVRDLNNRAVPTVRGGKWIDSTVRAILMNARYVGLIEHDGETVPGSWEPVVSEDIWRAARAKLTDPARRTSPGSGRNICSRACWSAGCAVARSTAVRRARRDRARHPRRAGSPTSASPARASPVTWAGWTPRVAPGDPAGSP